MTSPTLTVAEVLDAAADLIEPEGAWTQGTEGRRKSGEFVLGDDPEACQWCAVGAMRKVGGFEMKEQALSAMKGVVSGKVWVWNDRKNRTQAEVVAKLREAATKAREQGL